MKTTAIIPVKRRENANERLAAAVPDEMRRELAEAMFFDSLSNVRRSHKLDEVIVVTADPSAARTARWLGAEVLEQASDEGHSKAAWAGIELALDRDIGRVALLPADCPMFDARELDRNLGLIPHGALIIPDRHGTGTNGLVLSPPDALEPAFGPDSCARHVTRARAAGISYAVERIPSLALDVDTFEDLIAMDEALSLTPDRAPRTAELVWELGRGRETRTPTAA